MTEDTTLEVMRFLIVIGGILLVSRVVSGYLCWQKKKRG